MEERYLYIDKLVFKLPEGFNGNLTQALEEIVKYRKSEESKSKRKVGEKNDLYKSFSESHNAMNKNKGRLSLNFGFNKVIDGKIQSIDCLDLAD